MTVRRVLVTGATGNQYGAVVDHLLASETAFDVLVLINPNNPDGTYFEPETLLEWRTRIASWGGWMIADEALVDTTPEYSLALRAPLSRPLTLRSIGQLPGLAGMWAGLEPGPHDLQLPPVDEEEREEFGKCLKKTDSEDF
jgi:histidinol-phosphate/aromatic aminotransferase/cobyric acid decarboxylase-like protein